MPLDAALGLTLAAPLAALTDLPSFDTSAMDGWALAGPGPGRCATRASWPDTRNPRPSPTARPSASPPAPGSPRTPPPSCAPSTAAPTNADACTPPARSSTARTSARAARSAAAATSCCPSAPSSPWRSWASRPPPDTTRSPRSPRPRVDVLVLGDELLTQGLPHDGLIRDALGPMPPPGCAHWAPRSAPCRIGDDAEALHRAVTSSDADLIVTTGGTAAGPVDHVHPTLRRIGAELLVDGVKVRPGYPMLPARLKDDQHLVGPPGTLAAVSGLLTLAEPLLCAPSPPPRRPAPEPYTLPLRDAVHGHLYDTRPAGPAARRGCRAAAPQRSGDARHRGRRCAGRRTAGSNT